MQVQGWKECLNLGSKRGSEGHGFGARQRWRRNLRAEPPSHSLPTSLFSHAVR